MEETAGAPSDLRELFQTTIDGIVEILGRSAHHLIFTLQQKTQSLEQENRQLKKAAEELNRECAAWKRYAGECREVNQQQRDLLRRIGGLVSNGGEAMLPWPTTPLPFSEESVADGSGSGTDDTSTDKFEQGVPKKALNFNPTKTASNEEETTASGSVAHSTESGNIRVSDTEDYEEEHPTITPEVAQNSTLKNRVQGRNKRQNGPDESESSDELNIRPTKLENRVQGRKKRQTEPDESESSDELNLKPTKKLKVQAEKSTSARPARGTKRR